MQKRAVEKELRHLCTWDAGPIVVQMFGRGALGSVDVFSVNVYDSRVRMASARGY